jgi:hypothetical protein
MFVFIALALTMLVKLPGYSKAMETISFEGLD